MWVVRFPKEKKWLSVFSDVTCVIFLVAINEYDLMLEEDQSKNRLLDSLTLWHQLSGSTHLVNVPFILFLNKSDLFAKKIKDVPVSSRFDNWDSFVETPAMKNLSEFDQSWNFFARHYEAKFKGTHKPKIHLTSAVDTECCKKSLGFCCASFSKCPVEQNSTALNTKKVVSSIFELFQ